MIPVVASPRVDYRSVPTQYRHWKLGFEGDVATLSIDIAEDGGILPGYKLKLNSYDLGVDVELHDAVNRIRFEHPEVRTVDWRLVDAVVKPERCAARRPAASGNVLNAAPLLRATLGV